MDQIHITTKVWWQNLAPDAIRKAFDTSIAKLKTRAMPEAAMASPTASSLPYISAVSMWR
jgi:diketogulonate reductase-like aldo/keto reductase